MRQVNRDWWNSTHSGMSAGLAYVTAPTIVHTHGRSPDSCLSTDFCEPWSCGAPHLDAWAPLQTTPVKIFESGASRAPWLIAPYLSLQQYSICSLANIGSQINLFLHHTLTSMKMSDIFLRKVFITEMFHRKSSNCKFKERENARISYIFISIWDSLVPLPVISHLLPTPVDWSPIWKR